MGTVFADMSSSTALTGRTGMKASFKTKNMTSKYFGNFIIKILNFKSD